MYKGKVKWFNNEKGFGMIVREDGGDYFVHSSSIKSKDVNTLKSGETVLFDIGRGRNGLEAIFVLIPGSVVKVEGTAFSEN